MIKSNLLIVSISILFLLLFSKLLASNDEIKELEFKLSTQSKSEKIDIYNRLTKLYFQKDIFKSLRYGNLAESLSIVTKDSFRLAETFRNIGTAHYYSREYNISSSYYKRSLEIGKNLKDIDLISKAMGNLAMIKNREGKFHEALDLYLKTLNFIGDRREPSKLIRLHNNIAMSYSRIKPPDHYKAIQYREEALNNVDKNDTFLVAMLHKNISTSYFNLDKFEDSKRYVDIASQLIEGKGYHRLEMGIEQLYTSIYRETGLYDKSLESMERWQQLKDSINFKDSSDKLKRLQVEYEVKEKDNRIKHLEEIKDLNDKQLSQEIKYREYLTALLFLVLILVVIIYLVAVSRRRANSLLADKYVELAEINSELEDANSTKNRFFSIIAHDLKNPFTSILTASDLLLSSYYDLDDRARVEYIKNLNSSSLRILKLIESLFEWSKSISGQIEFQQEEVKLSTLLNPTIDLVKDSAKLKEITITNLITEDKIFYVDRNMAVSIIRNILNNSVKFTDDGGSITLYDNDETIDIEIPINQSPIYIKDNGIGIPKNQVDKLFNIDNHFSTRGTKNETGSGLGLLLCKEFVVKHDGIIGVKSIEGEGSIFYFTLPLKSNN